MLSKVSEICVENVKRIEDNYNQMYQKLIYFPKNEGELLVLKKFIYQHEKNIISNQKSMNHVDEFLDLLKKYIAYKSGTTFSTPSRNSNFTGLW